MLKIVFIIGEGLSRVERRINVDQLDLAHVLLCQLRHTGQGFEDIPRLSEEQQVIVLRLKIGAF